MGAGQVYDMVGLTFGRLRVIKRHEAKGPVKWDCECTCGNTAAVSGQGLRQGWTKSCGCLRREVSKARAIERARRGGLKLLDPKYRKSDVTASRRADEPRKTWISAESAWTDLNALWQMGGLHA